MHKLHQDKYRVHKNTEQVSLYIKATSNLPENRKLCIKTHLRMQLGKFYKNANIPDQWVLIAFNKRKTL